MHTLGRQKVILSGNYGNNFSQLLQKKLWFRPTFAANYLTRAVSSPTPARRQIL